MNIIYLKDMGKKYIGYGDGHGFCVESISGFGTVYCYGSGSGYGTGDGMSFVSKSGYGFGSGYGSGFGSGAGDSYILDDGFL